MMRKRLSRLLLTAAILFPCLPLSHAQNLRIVIPRRSELTPVQRLNRDGVDAVRRQDYEKAEGLFYKAYLYDPADPFTLNNLGYIAEVQGQLDRAQSFYKLAAEQGTSAVIDESNEKQLEGKHMSYALESLQDRQMRINRINFDAMTLLTQNRGYEAQTLLKAALMIDPHNAFTLNNLGVASESMGDYDTALRYYNAAAADRSAPDVVVTTADGWRGHPVSQMAAANAQRLQQRMQQLNGSQEQSAMLAARGVAAVNRNDWRTARQDFLQAYRLDPYSAFSLNNAGYVAERDGDAETAQLFYLRAQQADNAHAPVGYATRSGAAGNPLAAVASNNDQETENKIEQEHEERRLQNAPIELLHRNGTPVKSSQSAQPTSPSDETPPQQQPQ
ncbi:MAG TPA: tetratricopeptide repeat protein [Acidobacteriaceae bacterium]|nr:tetratricopeptide repeat protein [Acidobacteriaceae bacterium]